MVFGIKDQNTFIEQLIILIIKAHRVDLWQIYEANENTYSNPFTML